MKIDAPYAPYQNFTRHRKLTRPMKIDAPSAPSAPYQKLTRLRAIRAIRAMPKIDAPYRKLTRHQKLMCHMENWRVIEHWRAIENLHGPPISKYHQPKSTIAIPQAGVATNEEKEFLFRGESFSIFWLPGFFMLLYFFLSYDIFCYSFNFLCARFLVFFFLILTLKCSLSCRQPSMMLPSLSIIRQKG